MKKLFILLFSIVVLLGALLFTIPQLFGGRIADLVKSEAGEHLEARVDFSGVDLGLLRNFPDLTLTIQDLVLINKAPFSGDTLLALQSFQSTIDLWDAVFNDVIIVKSLEIIKPRISLRQQGDANNWDIIKDSPNENPATTSDPGNAFSLLLDRYAIHDGWLGFSNQDSTISLIAEDLNHQGQGRFSQDAVSWITATRIQSLTMKMAGVNTLNQVDLELDLDMDADLNRQVFTIKENRLRLNNLVGRLEGQVSRVEEALDLDLRFATEKAEFRELVSLVPAIYRKGITDLRSSGRLALEGFAKGLYDQNRHPVFEITVIAENGMIQYPGMAKPVHQIDLNFVVKNPGKDLNDTVIELKKLHFEIEKQAFDATAVIQNPLSGISGTAQLNGVVQLDRLQPFLPLADNETLKGTIQTHLTAEIKNGSNRPSISANGSLAFTDLVYESPDLPETITMQKANLRFSEKQVVLSSLAARIGASDLSAQGRLNNLLNYALQDGTVSGDLKLSSRFVDLNPWLADEEGALVAIELPERVSFTMEGQFDRVLYDNLSLDQVSGRLVLEDQSLSMENITMATLGGSATMTGRYRATAMDKPMVDLALNLKKLEIGQTFASMISVQKLVPIAAHVAGNFDAQLSLKSALEPDLTPVWSSLLSEGRLNVAQATLSNFVPFAEVAQKTGLSTLRNPVFTNINHAFKISGGRFVTQPFKTQIAGYDVEIQGSHHIDEGMDYKLGIDIPAENFKSKTESALSSLLGKKIDAASLKTVRMNMDVGGTIKKPTVQIAFADIAKGLAGDVKGVVQEGITGLLNKEQKGEAGTNPPDSTKSPETVKDLLQQSLEKEKTKLQEKPKSGAQKLLDRLKGKKKKP